MASTSNLSHYYDPSFTSVSVAVNTGTSAIHEGPDRLYYYPGTEPETEGRKVSALRARIASLERDRDNYRLLGARLRSFFRTRNCRTAVDRMVFNIELIEGTVTDQDVGALVDVIAQALSEYEESRPEHER